MSSQLNFDFFVDGPNPKTPDVLVDIIYEFDWLLVACAEHKTAPFDHHTESIPLTMFLQKKKDIEQRLKDNIGEKYTIASLLLGNGKHFIAAYQMQNGEFSYIDDLGTETQQEYIDDGYEVVNVLIVKTSLLDKYPIFPTLCPFEENRCMTDSCVSMLLRLPQTWWDTITTKSIQLENNEMNKVPFIQKLLQVKLGNGRMNENETVNIQKMMLKQTNAHRKYGKMANGDACLSLFFKELNMLSEPPFNIPKENIIMETAREYINTYAKMPTLVFQKVPQRQRQTSNYSDRSIIHLN